MAGQTPTIYNVARKAGVSPATVSRVLNEPSRVQAETRKRVVEAIAALGFVPKADAVAHARKQYKKIGVIAPFFTEPSFMQRLRGLSSVLSGKHYELVIYAIESIEELEEYVDMLASNRRVDGLVVLCLDFRDEMISALRESGLPACFVESEAAGFDSVTVDNYEGGRMAARMLFERGYRNPAFIGEASSRPFAVPSTDIRLRGFRDFFAEQGIALEEHFTWLGEFSERAADRGIESMLKGGTLPDCVFAASDMIAIRLLKLAAACGISVPKDLAVVGFDDLDIADYLGLSTISQALDESGRLAAEMILDRLRDPERPARKIIAALEAKERGSVGTVSAAVGNTQDGAAEAALPVAGGDDVPNQI